MKVLVTGVKGQLGYDVMNELAKRGYEGVGVDVAEMDITDSAAGFGADMLITACPLCKYNLNKNASSELPVYYFTELLAEALGVKEEVAK